MNSVVTKMNWRYATKKYDSSKIISPEKLERILEVIRLTPTSSGLQPYELFVIQNPEIRKKIKEVGCDQAQIIESSHLLVFAVWDDITPERLNMMFDLTNEIRGVKNQGWEDYRETLLGIVAERGKEENFNNSARQAYIGLGSALFAAAFEGVDATPMEGFDPEKVDEILGLRAKNLRSVVLLSLGYRAEEGDWLVNLAKVRRSRGNFVTDVK